MTAAKVYLDEDVHGFIADALRLRGRETLTTVEARRQGATDRDQVNFATANGYVLVSYNVTDFPRLHYDIVGEGQHHAGIIVATQDDPTGNLRALLSLIDSFSAEDLADELLYLNNWLK